MGLTRGWDLKKGVDLRPGELVNKAPGERFELATRGTFQPAPTPKEATRIRASALTIHLLDSSLTGNASAELKGGTTAFDLTMKGSKLDADRMLLSDEASRRRPPRGQGTSRGGAAQGSDRF